MKLWLVRHAKPLVDEGVCYGASDLDADPAATAAAAQELAQLLPLASPLHVSPLRRCQQLATALCQLRADLQPLTEPRLAELDFGNWEGRRWDSIDAADHAAWTADFAHYRPGGGESVQAFMQHIAAVLKDQTDPQAVWISHAGVVRAVTLISQGKRTLSRADEWRGPSLAFGTCCVLELQAGQD